MGLTIVGVLVFLCYFVNQSLSDPRATEAALICGNISASMSDRQVFVATFLAALDSLTSLVTRNRYGAVVNGSGNTTVYAFGECMEDLSRNDCNLCFARCKTQILRCLPFQRLTRGGRLFFDGCYLRYDSYSFFNESLSLVDKTVCGENDFGGNQSLFRANVGELVRNLSIGGVKNHGFFAGSVDRGNLSVYGLAQCWELVNGSACEKCLANSVSKIGSCPPKDEGRVLNSGCYMRYSTQKFYGNNSGNDVSFGNGGGNSRLAIILAATSCAIAVVLFVAAVSFFVWKKFVKQSRGRMGYMAPEYVVRGQLTEKADVYSFGVLVVEVVCGKKNSAFSHSILQMVHLLSILKDVWNLCGTGRLCEAVDSSLNGNFQEDEASRLLRIGLLCAQASAELRPSMSSVVKMVIASQSQPILFEEVPNHPKMEKIFKSSSPLFILTTTLLLLDGSMGEPRAQTIQTMCGNQLEHNSTIYVPNFVATMENISEQIRTSGFGVAVTGSGPDTNYGLAQCYGDLSLLDCVLCYAEARTVLPQCFPYNGGRIYLEGCFMRAENYSFFEEYTGPGDTALCGNTTRKNSTFQETARQAVLQAVSNAPNNNNYARNKVAVSGTRSESVYVLANCWRTLNASACNGCLENASSSILGCLPWSEGRALNTGCFMRYSDTNFLNPEPGSGSSRGKIIVIVVAVVSSVVVLVVGAAIAVYIRKHRYIQKKRRGSNDAKKMAKTLHDSSLNFKYSTIEKATGSFAEANKLGQGGFGTVYKGALHDGREIAVKRLFFNNRFRAADFYNEVNIISSVEHKNLVRLLGCSCSGPESLLVYEFLPNKSLDRFIFDVNRGKTLNWEKRREIIIGTAEGLVYLHENTKTRIIHRDIKASNILLDTRFRAKIADFGLARSFQEDQSHISTAIAGTLGYMAPEYLAHGQLTEKVDVYSFGVLLLEIVTGRQNNRSKTSEYSESLVTIAWRHFQLGTVEELFDANLTLHNYHNNEILRVVHVGLLCTQEIPSLRPSMSKALDMLAKKEERLPPPTNPPFIDEKTMELNDTSENPSYPLNATNSDSVATVSNNSFHPR
ncbi:hypothetical protein RJ639_000347 [Escallonia herrerae]|uniref:Cysteine-rich receptor-like protein kinase 2 n=1 Tax=Escallonia herrerae TaxID=1293975 RepID=A0AA88X917_9ASTE|nr:hypothetical protein RJ639_000347 [Escallonia herrerae]